MEVLEALCEINLNPVYHKSAGLSFAVYGESPAHIRFVVNILPMNTNISYFLYIDSPAPPKELGQHIKKMYAYVRG